MIGPRRGHRRRWLVWGAGAGIPLLLLSGALAHAAMAEDERDPLAAVPDTVEVVRATLVRSERVSGELSHERVGTVRSAGSGATVTWLPDPGEAIERGGTLYRSDDRPRVLLYGDTPFYRELSVGHRGPDVAVLERNLTALGYTGFTEDRHYTWATARAVLRWQRDLGVERTGRVSPDDVHVAEGPVRVGALSTEPGAPDGGELMELTAPVPTIGVDLEADRRHLVEEGTPVEVEFPDGRVTTAEVSEIDGVVRSADSDSSLSEATVRLSIHVTDEEGPDEDEVSPVEVLFEVDRAEDVLVVPLEALIALGGGGHGLQRVSSEGDTEYVPVETGLFADGLVEVSGGGIAAGDRVGVPA